MPTPESEQLSPLQIKDLVYEKLRTAIIDQTFAAGEPLREAALTERFGVSKTPIREALVRLEQDGLVEIAPYRGARAKKYSPSDLHEIYAAREILEAECVRRAARSKDPVVVGKLRENIAASRAALVKDDLDGAADALDEFDEVLFAGLENSLLEDIQRRLGAHLRRVGQVGRSAERFSVSIDEHERIVDAIAAGSAAKADALLRAHLRSVLETQLAVLEEADAAS
ncbi:GntR family transcriptional regulator [Microbacterium sp. SLBN-146]|uniref:GntR family transcriptional regulator n=1 Tax=Microbacterium sp. SLBN-146 TaxID=2768457 RepID=UPI00115354A2|nr:GntR family transcriptional regulator [Microbacterium sp. SLBN-146]TQJ29984.1 GntR family transcriptional regulator [Microbacterium sp. SLBN-146]